MRAIILLSILFLFTPAQGSEISPKVGQYVNKLVDQVSSMLANQSLSEVEKISKSQELLSNNLDFDWMASYALGREKNKLTPTQLDEFKKSYTQYVIKAYSSLVKNYNGEKTKINKVYAISDNEYIANTEVAKAGKNPIKVDYLIHLANSNFKIADIITENVSLINSQQAEFSSTLTNSGFEELLKRLNPVSKK